MEFTPTELITLQLILEHIFRDEKRRWAYYDLVGDWWYEETRQIWYAFYR